MRLLVTGICGRLGRAIAVEASALGHTVIGVDLRPWPAGQTLPPGIQVLVGSFEDMKLTRELLQSCEAMIHTAGPHGEHVGKLDLAEFLHLNVEGVARLLETALNVGVRRAVLSSTMEILLGRDWTASGATFVDEESTPRPDSAYSISCFLREQLGRELSRLRDISIASLRYMAFSDMPDDMLGPRLLARSVSSRDAARAAICAASLDNLCGHVFHIGPKTPLTNNDISGAFSDPKAILEKYFPGATLTLDKHGFKTMPWYFWPVTNIRKAKLILGWEPEYTFETWLVAHGWTREIEL